MDTEILALIDNLGTHAENAYYVYIALDYGSSWVLIGLSVWGIRTIWDKVKSNI